MLFRSMGAIASGGVRVLNESIVRQLHISPAIIELVAAREQQEIERRERLYRAGRPALPIQGRTVILVDDGLATGASMLAAARAVQAQQPKRIIVAVPAAARATCDEFRQYVDEVICLQTPEPFYAVGAWYENFSQVSDAEVQQFLERAQHEQVT